VAQLCPIDPKKLLAFHDKKTALSVMIRIFEEEILDQLDDMDQCGLLVDDQIIEGFGQGLLEELGDQFGSEMEIYQEAVERAVIRVQGLRQTSH
jgi:hypothetical protein